MKTKVKQTQQVQEQPLSLTKQFRDMIVKEAELWYDCSITAYKIYKNKEWEKEGYLTVRDYVDAEFSDLGISYRVFMYRVKMGEALINYEVSRDDVAGIGWSKFKEIAKVLLDDDFPIEGKNAKTLIGEAKEKSVRELQESIREKQLMYKEELVAKKLSLKFSLFNEHANIVEEALNTAKSVFSTDDDNMALVYICMDYLTNHITDNKAVEKIKSELTKMVAKQ